jgi:hypothetical protein
MSIVFNFQVVFQVNKLSKHVLTKNHHIITVQSNDNLQLLATTIVIVRSWNIILKRNQLNLHEQYGSCSIIRVGRCRLRNRIEIDLFVSIDTYMFEFVHVYTNTSDLDHVQVE